MEEEEEDEERGSVCFFLVINILLCHGVSVKTGGIYISTYYNIPDRTIVRIKFVPVDSLLQ
jgi:hypothetical protein